MKKAIIAVMAVTLLTIVHFGLTFVLFLMDFSVGMSQFDTGDDPTIIENALHVAATVMMWPIFEPMAKWGGHFVAQLFPGVLGYIPMLTNSLVWGLAVWLILGRAMWRRKRSTEP